MKVCPRCDKPSPPENYRYKRKCCDDCQREKRRYRYGRNRAAEQAAALERYHKSPEKARAANAAWREANRERRAKTHRRSQLKRDYGLSAEDYDAMLAAQHYGCALCSKPAVSEGRQLCVDHCHKTGTVRALLCNGCNTGIGKLKESPALLRLAAKYVEHFGV